MLLMMHWGCYSMLTVPGRMVVGGLRRGQGVQRKEEMSMWDLRK